MKITIVTLPKNYTRAQFMAALEKTERDRFFGAVRFSHSPALFKRGHALKSSDTAIDDYPKGDEIGSRPPGEEARDKVLFFNEIEVAEAPSLLRKLENVDPEDSLQVFRRIEN